MEYFMSDFNIIDYKGFYIKKENNRYNIYKSILVDFYIPISDWIMGYAKTLKEAKQKIDVMAKNRKAMS